MILLVAVCVISAVAAAPAAPPPSFFNSPALIPSRYPAPIFPPTPVPLRYKPFSTIAPTPAPLKYKPLPTYAPAPAPLKYNPAPAPVPVSRVSYNPDNVQVLKFDNDNLGLGNYRYYFEQTDGTKSEQNGQIKNQGQENESIAVSGSYSWISPEGIRIVVSYTADEDGYKPEIEEGPGPGTSPAVLASLLG